VCEPALAGSAIVRAVILSPISWALTAHLELVKSHRNKP